MFVRGLLIPSVPSPKGIEFPLEQLAEDIGKPLHRYFSYINVERGNLSA
jgi:hypothetical protein